MNTALFFTFMVQEPVTSSLVASHALEKGFSLSKITFIFLFATSLDIFIGYTLGNFIKTKSKKISFKISHFITKHKIREKRDSKLYLGILLVPFFPYSTVITPFLNLSFKEAFKMHALGELFLWYPIVLLSLFGIKVLQANIFYTVFLVLFITLLFKLLFQFLIKKIK